MVSAAELKDNNIFIRGSGYSSQILSRPSARVQWYRKDGIPLPKLLPCDPHHMRLFRKKGWTLTPPEGMPKAALHVARIEEIDIASTAQMDGGPPLNVTNPGLFPHRHRYYAQSGKCRVVGCTQMRQKQYKKRK